MELKITSERVQEAAKSCPDAKRVLEKLFPEEFEPKEPELESFAGLVIPLNIWGLGLRRYENYKGRALCLGPGFAWKIEIDSAGYQVLTATKKV